MSRNHFLFPLSGLFGGLALLGATFGIVDPVQAAGFERATSSPRAFHSIIDDFNQFAHLESGEIDKLLVDARKLDNNRLNLTYDADITFYFIDEGAIYRTQLGMSSVGTSQNDPTILFNDIACTKGCSLTGHRDPDLAFGTPDGKALAKGDYFDIGTLKAGTTFDFFLRQDGYNRSEANIWHTVTEQNSDRVQHLMAYDYKDYLVLAFEDRTNGGDKDYNDVIFVVDIKKENVDAIPSAATPEPTQWAGIGLAILLGLRLQRLQKSQSARK